MSISERMSKLVEGLKLSSPGADDAGGVNGRKAIYKAAQELGQAYAKHGEEAIIAMHKTGKGSAMEMDIEFLEALAAFIKKHRHYF